MLYTVRTLVKTNITQVYNRRFHWRAFCAVVSQNVCSCDNTNWAAVNKQRSRFSANNVTAIKLYKLAYSTECSINSGEIVHTLVIKLVQCSQMRHLNTGLVILHKFWTKGQSPLLRARPYKFALAARHKYLPCAQGRI